MANYETLKSAIQQVVKTNGNNEITGALLQQSLLAMINSLGSGYQFIGVATPTTNPGTPDQKVFYIYGEPGEYRNFNNVIINGGIGVFLYDSDWSHIQIIATNDAILNDSNLIQGKAISNVLLDYITGFIPGITLTQTGKEIKNAELVTSKFIDVSNIDTCIWKYINNQQGIILCVYNDDRQIVDYFTSGINDSRTIDLTALAGAKYVRASFPIAQLFNGIKIIGDGNTLWEPSISNDTLPRIKELERDIEDIKEPKTSFILNYISGIALTIKGQQEENALTGTSDFIHIDGITQISCDLSSSTPVYAIVYDENKQFVDYWGTSGTRTFLTNGNSYLRITFELTHINNVYVKGDGNTLWEPSISNDTLPRIKELEKHVEKHVTPQDYLYDGEPIVIRPLLHWEKILNLPYVGIIQDACCYADLMFQFFLQESHPGPEGCIVYDLNTKEQIQTIPIDRHGFPTHHNSVCFGVEKYSENDEFPVLYSSSLQRYSGQSTVDVFRITGTRGEYAMSLVQRIFITKTYDSYLEPSCFVDPRGYLYVTWIYDQVNRIDKIEKYNLPLLSDGETVTIPNEDKLSIHDLPTSYPYGPTIGQPQQGGIIYNGKLYFALGFASCAWLIVYDLDKEEIVSTIDFSSMDLDAEPEGAFVWKNHLIVPFNALGGTVAQFTFQ